MTTKTAPPRGSREQDELWLDWLSLHGQGYSFTQIAGHYGVTRSQVAGVIKRDKAECYD